VLVLKLKSAGFDKFFEIGVVIHRISPTKYNLDILDSKNIEDIVEIKKLDIGRFIERLASDTIASEVQASLIPIYWN